MWVEAVVILMHVLTWIVANPVNHVIVAADSIVLVEAVLQIQIIQVVIMSTKV